MKKLITSIFAVAATATVASSAVLVGLDPLIDNGGPDGWSGITVLETPIEGSGTVTDWGFYADDERAAVNVGEHFVTPLLVGNNADGLTILGVGAEVQVNVAGVHQQTFDVQAGTADFGSDAATTYHGGFWQRREGQDDTEGGIVPFSAAGGSGMFQINQDGTTYSPTAGEVLPAAGHASGVDGRNYAFNVQGTVVPEPSVPAFLIATVGLVGFLRRRR